jgi:stage II sporulation protein R
MKKNTRLSCTVFLLLLLFVQGSALADGGVIRLHVIANSNSAADQRLKEQVRDRIVKELGPVLAEMEQKEVAAWILANRGALTDLASSEINQAGQEYKVQVRFEVENYPTRAYRSMAFPEGKYRSVQIILGKGAGRNWWCLLFPPLCYVDETVTGSACAPQETEEIEVRFWLWEKICALFKWLF